MACQALAFGDFTLKSGRRSPYFMNMGQCATAAAAQTLARLYGEQVRKLAPHGAVLLGLPYKGIPLAALACAACPPDGAYAYAYLRKEAKEHGEGGLLVGTVPVAGQTLILIDDVLTAGTAARAALATLAQPELGLHPEHLLVAFDREERPPSQQLTAREGLARDPGLRVSSIATATDLLDLTGPGLVTPAQSARIKKHLATYGAG